MNYKNYDLISHQIEIVFFILSKILAIFIQPITWVLACLVGSFWARQLKWKKRLFASAVILLLFFSNQYISNRVMLWWEPEPVPIATLGTYDVGIVFSGVTKGSKRPRDRVYFNYGADRITHALQLYNEGKIKRILISGGLGFQQETSSLAAERLRSFLLMAHVPDSVISIETDAVNTYENAVKSAKILQRDFPRQKYLLITSAFHMKRSALCLKKQGITFDEFPAGYYTDYPTMNFDDLFIPKSTSVKRWELMSKEWAGILTYRLMGYL